MLSACKKTTNLSLCEMGYLRWTEYVKIQAGQFITILIRSVLSQRKSFSWFLNSNVLLFNQLFTQWMPVDKILDLITSLDLITNRISAQSYYQGNHFKVMSYGTNINIITLHTLHSNGTNSHATIYSDCFHETNLMQLFTVKEPRCTRPCTLIMGPIHMINLQWLH